MKQAGGRLHFMLIWSTFVARIHIVSCTEPLLQVEGFANYMDVQASDLVPWTPLKVGYSGMDPEAALFTLRQVAPHFVDVVTAEASTLPDGEGEWIVDTDP